MPSIGTIKLATPVMNGACNIAKSFDDIDAMVKTQTSAILIGSITIKPRPGNPAQRWYAEKHNDFTLNSFGMPNKGSKWYQKNLSKMITLAKKAGKPFILSVAGFTIQEYIDLAKLGEQAGVDLIELNLGCPNAASPVGRHKIFSFDAKSIKNITIGVDKALQNTPYTLKLSPYSNPDELAATAKIIAKSNALGVVTSNSFPNSYWEHSGGKPVIESRSGLAGMGGEAMLPIALGQVKQFRQHLPPSKIIIGVGGISKAEHVKMYLRAGAVAVQVVSHIVKHGHSSIDKILKGF
jgi:dihydroorotate dehydrogenase